MHGGLEQATLPSLGWAAPSSRTVIHITDAPGHGRRLKDTSVDASVQRFNVDDEPLKDFDADGSQLRTLMLKLREELKVTKNMGHYNELPNNSLHTHFTAFRCNCCSCASNWLPITSCIIMHGFRSSLLILCEAAAQH